jgi:shikimate kinase
MKPKIFLCGFMGSGKTTIGRILAEDIQYKFADTDLMLEEAQNMTIGDIFKTKGEDYFREEENRILRKIISESGQSVIALGSGILMNVNNLKIILDAGLLIHLQCDWKIILERLQSANRKTYYNSEDLEITWEYHKINYPYAGFTVNVSGKSPALILEELRPCVQNMRKLIAKQIQIE